MAGEKDEGWGFTLEDALKVGVGLAVGAGAVKYAMGQEAPPKKASANTGDGPPKKRRKKRRAKGSADESPASSKGSAAASAYNKYVKKRMPYFLGQGYKSSDAMSKIGEEWRAGKR